ncbi:peptidoglycan-binding protein LysM [Paenibacillus sp. TAB 01]|uniref:peptidoglycan-binding protein LysM n=1 Tax=Paenibacillus sp. TAB 01 TaxID=3368988 RepID=UPI003751996F
MAEEQEYGIYLSWNNQAESFQIPVNPESIEVKEQGQGKTYNIVGKGGGTDETRAGEVNVIQSPKLKEVTFSSIFPSQYYPFVNSNVSLFVPMHYINLIRKWMESKHPIRFIFAGSYKALAFAAGKYKFSDLNFPASIESFEWKEVAGSPGDIEYTLKLKEYVFYSARRVTVVTQENGETVLVQQPPDRPDERVRPETYTLRRDGESLMEVAKRLLGNDGRAREIQKLNNIPEDKFYLGLPAGTVLKIPQN